MSKATETKKGRKGKATTFPAYEMVKKDLLESRRKVNKWFSIYKRYDEAGILNTHALNCYFIRFKSELINVYNQVRSQCKERGFENLLEIDKYLMGNVDFGKSEWIGFWNILNELLYDMGVTKIETMYDMGDLEDKEYTEMLEYENEGKKG